MMIMHFVCIGGYSQERYCFGGNVDWNEIEEGHGMFHDEIFFCVSSTVNDCILGTIYGR